MSGQNIISVVTYLQRAGRPVVRSPPPLPTPPHVWFRSHPIYSTNLFNPIIILFTSMPRGYIIASHFMSTEFEAYIHSCWNRFYSYTQFGMPMLFGCRADSVTILFRASNSILKCSLHAALHLLFKSPRGLLLPLRDRELVCFQMHTRKLSHKMQIARE